MFEPLLFWLAKQLAPALQKQIKALEEKAKRGWEHARAAEQKLDGLLHLYRKLEDEAEGYVVECFQDVEGDWRWRLKSPNNKIMAVSGEGYKRFNSLDKSLNKVIDLMSYVEVQKKV